MAVNRTHTKRELGKDGKMRRNVKLVKRRNKKMDEFGLDFTTLKPIRERFGNWDGHFEELGRLVGTVGHGQEAVHALLRSPF